MRISCKICRRLGMSVCGREKCAFRRKPYPPGVHGRQARRGRRGGISEYGLELQEKQRLKFLYGLREAQFRNYVEKALVHTAGTAVKLLELLESRLDNAVFRLGFATSRALSRQLVSHGHIMVNGRRVTIPSLQIKKGDRVSIRPQSLTKGAFRDLDLYLKKYNPLPWLSLDKDKKEGEVLGKPDTADPSVAGNININAIVEFYSR